MKMMLVATWQRCLGGWSGFLPDSSSPELISSYLNLSLISSRYEGSQPLIHLSSHSISHTISHLIMFIWQQWGPTLATSIAALRRSRIARALGLSLQWKFYYSHPKYNLFYVDQVRWPILAAGHVWREKNWCGLREWNTEIENELQEM